MWILPNVEKTTDLKSTSQQLAKSILNRSKPISDRYAVTAQRKRNWFLAKRVSDHAILTEIKSLCTSSDPTERKSFYFLEVDLEGWDAWLSYSKLEYAARMKVNVDKERTYWATPTVRDTFDAKLSGPLPVRKDGKHRFDVLPRQLLHDEDYKGALNSRWVERAMGLPIGWTIAQQK